MCNEDIKKFAIKNGFHDAKEIGKYQDWTVFQPIFADGKKE